MKTEQGLHLPQKSKDSRWHEVVIHWASKIIIKSLFEAISIKCETYKYTLNLHFVINFVNFRNFTTNYTA